MKKLVVGTPDVISYGTLKNYVPSSTRASSSQSRSGALTSPKNDYGSHSTEVIFPFKSLENAANKQPQRRYELGSNENAAPQQERKNDKAVTSSQVLMTSLGSPKGNQKIKLMDEKKGFHERTNSRSSQRNSSTNSVSTATTATMKASDSANLKENIAADNKKARRGGLEISTELTSGKYMVTNGGPATTMAKSQTLKPRDINETHEGPLKKNSTVSNYSFDLNAKLKSSAQRDASQDKSKTQIVNVQASLRSNTPKNHTVTVEDEQDVRKSQVHRSGIFSKLFRQSPQKKVATNSSQRLKSENIQQSASQTRNLKFNNYFSNQQNDRPPSQAKELANVEDTNNNIDRKSHETRKVANKTAENFKQVFQQARNENNAKEARPSSAKEKKSSTLKDAPRVGKFFKDESPAESDPQSAKVEKVSLQSFVTKVSKGTTLATSMQIPHKQEAENVETNAGKRSSLKLEEPAVNQQKPPRTAPTKTPKTTTNAENRVFTFNNNDTKALRTSGQLSPSSSQQIRGHSPKTLKSSASLSRSAANTKSVDTTPFIYYATSLEKHHRKYSERDYFCNLFREHFIQSFQAMMFVKHLKPVDPKVLNSKKVNLPRRPGYEDKRTVVFDLDETLIHCNESTEIPSHVQLPIKFPHGEIVEAGINIRPYAIEALKELSQHFEIIVFTASHSCYANVVLDYLDPKGQYVHHRLFRESCVQTEEGIYVKDLRVFANRNLNDVVLVDNAAYSFAYQINNGIPIAPYYDNPEDEELKHLIPYLKFLNGVRDMKEINRQTFKLDQYWLYDTPEKVLEKVVFAK